MLIPCTHSATMELSMLMLSFCLVLTPVLADFRNGNGTNVECKTSSGGIKRGEYKKINDFCMKLTCMPDGTINVETCANPVVAEGCEIIPGNKNRDFPHCCEQFTCPLVHL